MEKKSSSAVASVVIVLLIIAGIGYTFYRQTRDNIKKVSLVSFSVEKPNLILESENLTKVEIWAVPTGSNIAENDYQKLGEATLTNSGEATQRWIFQIPLDPIQATDIFAKGYKENDLVGQLSLASEGEMSIIDLLWGGKSSAAESDIKLGGIASTTGISIKITKIIEDSRCPTDVRCIQAGKVVVDAKATTATGSSNITISTDKTTTLDKYIISLTKVTPDRSSTGTIIDSDYTFTISIAEDTKG